MKGLLYRVVLWSLGAVPVDAAGRRCLDETMADWRKETATAASRLASLAASARGIRSVFRCVAMVAVREVRSSDGAALLLRLAGWSIALMLVVIGFHWNDSIPLQDGRVPTGPIPGALLSVGMVLGGMPILAFLSAGIGRRRPVPGPRLGPAIFAGAVMFVAMGWVMPATNQAYREFVFSLQSTGPLPQPGINERSAVELVKMLFTDRARQAALGLNVRLVFLVAVPLMLVIGTSARQLGGWRRFTATLLSLLVFGAPLLSDSGGFEALVLRWPALLALVLITRTLVIGANREPEPA